jgi:hypothetical protein
LAKENTVKQENNLGCIYTLFKRQKLNIMKNLKESKNDVKIVIVFVNAMDSVTKTLTSKNYDFETIREEAQEEFLAIDPNASDDFWIDDLWVEGLDIDKIDWKEILQGKKGDLDQGKVDKLFEMDDIEEFAIKLQFIKNQGFDIDDFEDLVDDIYITDADDMQEGNFKQFYPYSWLQEQAEAYYPELLKALEKSNGESYFDWARLFSDNEVNGDFRSEEIGNYFVWSGEMR